MSYPLFLKVSFPPFFWIKKKRGRTWYSTFSLVRFFLRYSKKLVRYVNTFFFYCIWNLNRPLKCWVFFSFSFFWISTEKRPNVVSAFFVSLVRFFLRYSKKLVNDMNTFFFYCIWESNRPLKFCVSSSLLSKRERMRNESAGDKNDNVFSIETGILKIFDYL